MESDPKRKIDDVQDLWEQEAAAVPVRRNEPLNTHARTIQVLDAQHAILSDAQKRLQQRLDGLQKTLGELDKELSDENCLVDTESLEFDNSLLKLQESAASFINAEPVRQQQQDQPTLKGCRSSMDAFLKMDSDLTTAVDKYRARWLDTFLLEEKEDDQIERLALKYRRSELRKIKEAANRSGQEAYVKSLQRDSDKLKGLPQILAILRSSTETYERERHQIEKEEKELQTSMIEPLLDQAAESRIRMPLHINLTQEEARSMLEQADNLDVIFDILLRQRACQQLLAYAYELETGQKDKDQYVLHALVGEIKERQLAHEERMAVGSTASTPDRVQNDRTISRINKLFDRGNPNIFSVSRRRSFTDGSILNKVNTLLQYEKRWLDTWSDNFTTRLDAGTALQEATDKLRSALYCDTRPGEPLQLMPSSYIDLQRRLKDRVDEMQETVVDLEKNSALQARFLRRRQLVSLFYTDPGAFGELIKQYIEQEERGSS